MVCESATKRKIVFFIICNTICAFFIIQFLSRSLMPVIYDYGKYKCNSFMVTLINYVVQDQVNDKLKNSVVIENDENGVDINVEVLNSITNNVTMKCHNILYNLERGRIDIGLLEVLGIDVNEENIKRGIIYEVPMARAFDNLLVNGLGVKVPVKYKLIGEMTGQIVSRVKEYGINNALIEISMELCYKSKITIPMITEEVDEKIEIPLVIKLIQGDIPDYLLGTNFIGGER